MKKRIFHLAISHSHIDHLFKKFIDGAIVSWYLMLLGSLSVALSSNFFFFFLYKLRKFYIGLSGIVSYHFLVVIEFDYSDDEHKVKLIYKELRSENFQSSKIVICIYRKLLISCKEQMWVSPSFIHCVVSMFWS